MAQPGQARLTIGSLMALVGLVAVWLGLYRLVSGSDQAGRTEAVMTAHVIGLGLLVPLGTFAAYHAFAAGRPDRDHRAVLTLLSGCVAWTFVFGSLVFWFLVMVIGVAET